MWHNEILDVGFSLAPEVVLLLQSKLSLMGAEVCSLEKKATVLSMVLQSQCE